ncbi:general secretion pathway protein K [Oxalobacteraceae bacterium GrIS 1.11]
MKRAPRPDRQRGVAVITALLLTTLAVTIVTSLFWQQQVQVRSMENQRLHLQTKWILLGAIDYSRFVLRQDGITNGKSTTLDGVWATPLAESRLDQFVDRERVEDENFEATLSGQILDAQGRFNLNNLASNRSVNPAQLAAFKRLLVTLQLDPGLALATAKVVSQAQSALAAPTDGTTPPIDGGAGGVAPGTGPSPGTGPTPGVNGNGSSPAPLPPAPQDGHEPLQLVQVEDLLSVPGFTPQAVERLRDFVIVLPAATPLNVNTASPEVLSAVVDNFSLSEATTLTVSRQRSKFGDVNAFNDYLKQSGKTLIPKVEVDIKSSYFLAMSRIRLDRAALDSMALIWRQNNPQMTTSVLWIREN